MREFVFIFLSVLMLGGCTSFTRTVVNGYVRDIDTAWIEPGKTTRDDVVARLGRPPDILGIKSADDFAGHRDGLSRHFLECLSVTPPGVDVKDEDVDGDAQRAFRWFAVDSFNGKFEGGKWIVPTFAKGHVHRSYDILILFDRAGVVSLVCRTAVVDDKTQILEWRERK